MAQSGFNGWFFKRTRNDVLCSRGIYDGEKWVWRARENNAKERKKEDESEENWDLESTSIKSRIHGGNEESFCRANFQIFTLKLQIRRWWRRWCWWAGISQVTSTSRRCRFLDKFSHSFTWNVNTQHSSCCLDGKEHDDEWWRLDEMSTMAESNFSRFASSFYIRAAKGGKIERIFS